MITIITGTPGAGKTALAVDMLRKTGGRPVFAMGVTDLKLPHVPVPPISQWTEMRPSPEDETVMVPFFTFPEGALIIIDEAQYIFPARASGSPVPRHVVALTTHRKLGLDFWLITQDVTFFDTMVRKLCNRHIHLRSWWMGRHLYEWPEVNDVTSKAARDVASSRRYRLPKEVFSLYTSASKHVKVQRRIPAVAFVLVAVVVSLFVGGWRLYSGVSEKVSPVLDQPDPPLSSSGRPASAFVSDPASSSSVPTGTRWDDYVPRIPVMPETAPLYDGIRTVKAMPVIAGCIAMRDRCVCVTDQGTDVGLSEGQCRDWIARRPFNPYREPVSVNAARVGGGPALAGVVGGSPGAARSMSGGAGEPP